MTELIPYIMSVGLTVLSGLAGIAVKILWGLATNVAELNSKMAVIVSEMANQGRRADRVDEQIEEIGDRLRHVERFLIS